VHNIIELLLYIFANFNDIEFYDYVETTRYYPQLTVVVTIVLSILSTVESRGS